MSQILATVVELLKNFRYNYLLHDVLTQIPSHGDFFNILLHPKKDPNMILFS